MSAPLCFTRAPVLPSRAVSCHLSWTGWALDFPNHFPFSARAHTLPPDPKTKYFPCVVHLPQHSTGGVRQPGNKGCRFVTSTETCQSEPCVEVKPTTLNRISDPSGDHAGS